MNVFSQATLFDHVFQKRDSHVDLCKFGAIERDQPRSQSSSAISDVTSPVKLVGKIRLGRLANNGKSKMAYLPGFMGKKRPPHFVAVR